MTDLTPDQAKIMSFLVATNGEYVPVEHADPSSMADGRTLQEFHQDIRALVKAGLLEIRQRKAHEFGEHVRVVPGKKCP